MARGGVGSDTGSEGRAKESSSRRAGVRDEDAEEEGSLMLICVSIVSGLGGQRRSRAVFKRLLPSGSIDGQLVQ